MRFTWGRGHPGEGMFNAGSGDWQLIAMVQGNPEFPSREYIVVIIDGIPEWQAKFAATIFNAEEPH